MSVGAGITPFHTDEEGTVRLATRAEELGYSDFGIAEGWTHDAVVLLARIAGVTSADRLGHRGALGLEPDAGVDRDVVGEPPGGLGRTVRPRPRAPAARRWSRACTA